MIKRSTSIILILAALAVIVITAGCTAPAQNKDILSGKDIFNPSKFSMATYMMGTTASTDLIGELVVVSYPGEKAGDRLASILITPSTSTRMDVWLNKTREGINKEIVTAIDNASVQVASPTAGFNMTTIDQTWNTPGSTYHLYGNESVTVPAGAYENCSVYYGVKSVVLDNETLNMSVLYYMHPSSPVPVLYVVNFEGGSLVYALGSVYMPGDIDSSPERAVQSYFDRLESGDYLKASRLILTSSGSTFKPMTKDGIDRMSSNMEQTFGKDGGLTSIQYVIVDSVQSIGDLNGYEAVTARWHSVQYTPSTGQIYSINDTFNMVNDNGGWKIIA
jgi:hypothetical protein